jgi:hypothetical protein
MAAEVRLLKWVLRGWRLWGAALATAAIASAPAGADVPYPTCSSRGCATPGDFGAYLFLAPGELPNDYRASSGDFWKFEPDTGMNVPEAWQVTTGRPDVVAAVLDSGIRWERVELARKIALNVAELPIPAGCLGHDCNGDGFVNVDDFAGTVSDPNANLLLDPQDLILTYSDGVDGDANGYVDDIAGWDFQQDDNDPFDDVDYGHGTGEGLDQVAEANNGGDFPGVAPAGMFVPLKVADSFVAVDSDFAQAVVYAVDLGVSLVSEALGTVNATPTGQAAVDYAYSRGIPVIASAADEESRHHNYPANFEHTIWVNSIRNGDGDVVANEDVYDILNGCTNYGGRAWVAIPSTSCSSEATGRSGGLTGLLVAHGRNLIDRGELAPYPGLSTPFSAEEVRQIFRASAHDIDHSADLSLDMSPAVQDLANLFLSAPAAGLVFASQRFPTQAGWDQFTGYGRVDAARMVAVTADTIPPEADLSGSVRWFDVIDPVATPSKPIVGTAAAVRAPGAFEWTLEVGCGVQPLAWTGIAGGASSQPLRQVELASWDSAASAAQCGFDPAGAFTDTPDPIDFPDQHTVTLRLRVVDSLGNLGEDRRTVAIHHDPTLRYVKRLGASGEGSPALADLDRDGVLDIVYGTTDGLVHALEGTSGAELPGFPVKTDPLPVHASPGYASGAVPIPHEGILAATAAGDLDGDGRIEVVVASVEGKLYVFDDHGRRRGGFPVASDPALSLPVNRDRFNDTDPGFVSAPTLADLDPGGSEPGLEIVLSGLDGHLYAWRKDGQAVAGFPVRLADRAKVSIDDASGKATPLPNSQAQARPAKSISSPAIGDLDGDGEVEIVVATNEEYTGEPNGFSAESAIFQALQGLASQLGETLDLSTQGRLYAVHHDGSLHAGGPFRAGWPVRVPLLISGILPTVGTGTPGSPALADVSGDGDLEIAIFGAIAPVMLFEPDGSSALGLHNNRRRALDIDFVPGGFPFNVPASVGSPDAPFFGALGSGAFGDLDADGAPEYAAPTGGLRRLLDVLAPGRQEFGNHQITAWNPRTGRRLAAFPRPMDDMQFLASPSIADVDGDGSADVIQGSGGYLVRAYRADGATPAGWPKFTHGWLISSPTPGDVDGDGDIEVVAATREGNLFVWDTPAPASEASIQWQGFGGDRHNSGNWSSDVPKTATGGSPLRALVWRLESIQEALPSTPAAGGSALAPIALELAIGALESGSFALGTALLPWIEQGLRTPPQAAAALEPLRAQLVSAVETALVRALAVPCRPGDTVCPGKRNLANLYRSFGDLARTAGDDHLAVALWGRALFLVLISQ